MNHRPPGWAETTVGEALDVKYGKPLEPTLRDPGAEYPVVGSAGRMTRTSQALVKAPAIVLGRKGNLGGVHLERGGCWPIDTTYYLAIPEGFEAAFLAYQFKSLGLERLDSSTATPSLRREDLEAQRLVVPPLEDQQHIVSILEDHLSRLDAALASLSSADRRLSSLGESYMRAELLGSLSSTRPVESRLPNVGLNDGEMEPLPVGWEWKRLGDLADVVGGVTKDSKRQNDPGYVEVPYLRVANVQRGRLDLGRVITIRVPPAKAAALELAPGDVLLNEGGDRDKLGRGWIWEGQIPVCIHQNHVFRARVRDAAIDPRLLSWASNVLGGPWCDRNAAQSVNLASISLTKIRQMPVPVPPPASQAPMVERISALLESLDRQRAEVADLSHRTQNLRRALLEAAFSGALTVRTANTASTREAVGV